MKIITRGLTVCVTGVWAGVDNAWEQEKLEARKILENAADSHQSGARFVRFRQYYARLYSFTSMYSFISLSFIQLPVLSINSSNS